MGPTKIVVVPLLFIRAILFLVLALVDEIGQGRVDVQKRFIFFPRGLECGLDRFIIFSYHGSSSFMVLGGICCQFNKFIKFLFPPLCLGKFSFEVFQLMFRFRDFDQQFFRSQSSHLVNGGNLFSRNGIIVSFVLVCHLDEGLDVKRGSGLDKAAFFEVDVSSRRCINNLTENRFAHVVKCLRPCGFVRLRFETPDELVGPGHRLFDVFIFVAFEVVNIILVIIKSLFCVIKDAQLIDNVSKGLVFLVHVAELFGDVAVEGNAQDTLVLLFVEVFTSAKIEDFGPNQFESSCALRVLFVVRLNHSDNIFLVHKILFATIGVRRPTNSGISNAALNFEAKRSARSRSIFSSASL